MRRHLLPFAAAMVTAAGGSAAEESTATAALSLNLRHRVADEDGERVVHQQVNWEAKSTAAIVCDMWDQHWCAGATRRVGEMAPVMNRVLEDLRRRGVLIIYAPSGCMQSYADHPARQRALGAPAPADTPACLGKWAEKLPSEAGAAWPVDDRDGGCDCEPQCTQGHPWTRQIAALRIDDADAITDSGREVWALLASRGIDHVLMFGVHTNMCVVGRPFGLRNLTRAGKDVALVRDLTDSMYNSRSRPQVSHFRGTDLVVEYIERYVCPTVLSSDLTGGAPFAFAQDRRPHVVFLIGEREYDTKDTLPAFAATELEPAGIRSTCVFAAADDGPGRHQFPGFAVVESADLVFISVRRRALQPAALAMLKAHVEAGRAIMGIRTASHAFSTRGQHPEGMVEWPELDHRVLGGNYHNHYGHSGTRVTLADGAAGHPILEGVTPFQSTSWLYKVRPLAAGTTPLLIGATGNAEPEPVAWTNRCGDAPVFYTSLGHPDDFAHPSFVRLLRNAIQWGLAERKQ